MRCEEWSMSMRCVSFQPQLHLETAVMCVSGTLWSNNMNTEFRLIEFNARRAQRGAEAARVAVIEDGDEQWLWMTFKENWIRNVKF